MVTESVPINAQSEHLRRLIDERMEMAGGSGGGGSDDLSHRLTALEAKFDSIVPTLATKAEIESVKTEVHKAIGAQTWKLISACTALVAAVLWITHHAG